MATLGSIYHDFPRLAKQSGFYFQLHTGRVNWSEIENLNVDEIIEKRNYELLEQNLSNVINCNLEREYDLKILDPNFVKLFKIAQLGIDYLSYCEMYLDKCVILLQEQLTAFQEEFETLKQDNQKRKEELNKGSTKSRTQSYQCEKCEKVFISDVYLKFHDKRRHSSPSTPNSSDLSQKKCIDNSQQTEDETKLSTSTQTLFLEKVTNPQDCGDKNNIKKEHTVKIEKLEQELKDLKERLKKAESSLTENVENCHLNQSNVLHPVNVTGSMCCNPMLMFLPSYIKQPGSDYLKINPGCQIQVPEVCQSSANIATSEVKLLSEKRHQLNFELEKALGKELTKEEKKICCEEECQNEGKEDFNNDKENMDPNSVRTNVTNMTKPLPPPRKLKKGIRPQPLTSDKVPIEYSSTAKKETHKNEEIKSCLVVHRSTPIKEKSNGEINWEIIEPSKGNLSETNKARSVSTESLSSVKSIPVYHESKSLIKKIVGRKSPKLRRFSRKFKRSLTNLYDSVSPAEKDSKKKQSSDDQNIKSTVVNSLNNRLRELGVDPEWQGIPKKTMEQKLNILKHQRKLLSKEYSLLPTIRQNIEEKIFQKIKNNLGRKKTTLINKLSKQGSMIDDLPQFSTEDISLRDTSDFVRVKKNAMYYTDTDSESKVSDSEGNFNNAPDQSISPKSVVLEELTSSDEEEKVDGKKKKEFDFSVFQVGGGSSNNLTEDKHQKNVSVIEKDEFFTDSDIDDNSVEHSEDKIFKSLNSYLSNKGKVENSESPKNCCLTEQLEVSSTKAENHGILKEEGLQSELSTTAKKRVLFANYSKGIDEGMSDSPSDDDLWPFKSDSENDLG